jgi:hypothetical protein
MGALSKEKQMSKVSIASIVVALGLCSGGSALAAQADNDKAWATAQIGEDSGAFHLSQQPWLSTRVSAAGSQEAPAPRRTGEAHVLHGEDSGSFHLSRITRGGAGPYAGPEVGVDTALRAAQVGAPAAP